MTRMVRASRTAASTQQQPPRFRHGKAVLTRVPALLAATGLLAATAALSPAALAQTYLNIPVGGNDIYVTPGTIVTSGNISGIGWNSIYSPSPGTTTGYPPYCILPTPTPLGSSPSSLGWKVYKKDASGNFIQVAAYPNVSLPTQNGWGARPGYCFDDNLIDYYSLNTFAPFSRLTVGVPSTAAVGQYRVDFTDTTDNSPSGLQTRTISAYVNVVAGTGAAPASSPTSLQATIQYAVGGYENGGTPSHVPFPQRYNFYPRLSWTPVSGARLVTLSGSGPAGRLPLTTYDILPLSVAGTSSDTGTYEYNASLPILQNSGTYQLTVKARNAYGYGPTSTPLSVTMPRYPDVPQGGQNNFVSELPGYRVDTTLPPITTNPLTHIKSPGYPVDSNGEAQWWVIRNPGGSIIATPSTPNGWAVGITVQSFSYPLVAYSAIDPQTCQLVGYQEPLSGTDASFVVTAPASAPVGLNYQVFAVKYQWRYDLSTWVPVSSYYGAPFNVVTSLAKVEQDNRHISPARLCEMKRQEGRELMQKMALERALSAPCRATKHEVASAVVNESKSTDWLATTRIAGAVISAVSSAHQVL